MYTIPRDTKTEEKRDTISDAEDLERDEEKKKAKTSGLFIKFFNTFCNDGGLNAVIDILSPDKLIKKSGLQNFGKCGMPLDTIGSVLSAFNTIKPIAKKEFIEDLVVAGEKAFFQKLDSLSEKEIKDVNKDLLLYSLNSMKGFLKLKYTEEQTEKIINSYEKNLFIKFIESPYLEKRLNGLTEIKRMIDTVDPTILQIACSRNTKLKYITSDDLVNWVIQSNILEKIINENAHAELIKRTSPILIFLAKRDKITNEIIDLLWKCQHEKHEDIIRVVYDIICNILRYLPIDVLKFIYFLIENQLYFPQDKSNSFRIIR